MKKLMNYTPHEVNLITESGEVVLKSIGVARVEEEVVEFPETEFLVNGKVEKIKVINKKFKKEVIGLPEEKENSDILYIVSAPVMESSNRRDIVGIGAFKRNDKGAVVGAFSLNVYEHQLN